MTYLLSVFELTRKRRSTEKRSACKTRIAASLASPVKPPEARFRGGNKYGSRARFSLRTSILVSILGRLA
jgi:hypothetical protein